MKTYSWQLFVKQTNKYNRMRRSIIIIDIKTNKHDIYIYTYDEKEKKYFVFRRV